MSKAKKNGRKNQSTEKILLATAIIHLIQSVIDLIDRLSR